MVDQGERSTRRTISCTCTVHGGVPGYTNLVVRALDGGGVELDPHATSACVLSLTELEARELHTVIGEMLG